MIITRTPLRISIGGGGTDLPSYYEHRGGFCISAAIDKYTYISMNTTFSDDYFLKYSELERVDKVADIRHPIIREAFVLHDVGPSVELVSTADMPSGTGLGSSGTFTVGLLRAIHAAQRKPAVVHDLAAEACHIEMDLLGEPCGKQDQYIAAFGGLTCFEFHPDGSVDVSPLRVNVAIINDLETHLLLFFTGYSRRASTILQDQKDRTSSDDATMLENLDRTKEMGFRIRDVLEAGDCEAFGHLMHEHWMNKRGRSSGMSNNDIDAWYQMALDAGAIGGKLVGAGAGGFLMVYAPDPQRVRAALADSGLFEVPFRFDLDGSIVLARS
ncbi:MAG: galactokinase [Actinomycetota bacterium]|nr:galactokinase [Actinomycetota bacterium]